MEQNCYVCKKKIGWKDAPVQTLKNYKKTSDIPEGLTENDKVCWECFSKAKQKINETKQSDDTEEKHKISPIKKTLPKKTGTKDAVIGFGALAIIIVIIVAVVVSLTNSGETKTESEPKEKEQLKNIINEGIDKGIISPPKSQQEVDNVVDEIANSMTEYQKTNEILKTYSTEDILDDILDDKTTALDKRIEYHSMTEPRKITDGEDLLYIVGEMKYEVTVCKQNTRSTEISDLLDVLRFDLEYAIKSGYAKDSSIIPILQNAKDVIKEYSYCINKSGKK